MYSYSLAETPQLPPFPPALGLYTRALLVSQYDDISLFQLMCDLEGMAENNAAYNRKLHLH
jgi:hypothetical protein